ncbi:Mpv17-like protein [Halotydeus destructor]|nr:Mpv17-like protein [Halotydeus destructor]
MLWRMYNRFLVTYPILSQQTTAVTLGALGDITAQFVVEKRKTWDPIRTLRFSCLGIVIAPTLLKWFSFLDSRFSKGALAPFKKMGCDQIFMAPAMNTLILVFLETTRGSSLEGIKRKMKVALPEILANNYKLWPAVQLINFYLVPLQYKILYTSLIAFFWNIYVTFTLQGDDSKVKISSKMPSKPIELREL